MPTTKSAKKRLRQSQAQRLRSRSMKSALRNQIRKVRESAVAGNATAAQAELQTAARHLDRASARGVIHTNAAARTKSRLSALVKGINAEGINAKAGQK